MKKLSALFAILFFMIATTFAQDVPQGMKYQAVARNLSGEILANQQITLQINLFTGGLKSPVVHYTEIHDATTNQFGLFNLTVGQGKSENGGFNKIPWSSQQIWMEVKIKDGKKTDFLTISNSELLTVPYAFHAGTAGTVTGDATIGAKKHDWLEKCPCEGGIALVRLLYLGPNNVNITVWEDKYHPQHNHDSIARFNNVQNGDILVVTGAKYPDKKLKNEIYMVIENTTIPVQEIPTSCDEQIVGENFGNFSLISHQDRKNLAECSVCDVRMDWKIDGNAVFDACNWLGTKSRSDLRIITNNEERVFIGKDGAMTVHDSLTVDRQSPTLLSGKLTVDGATDLNSSLNVDGITNLNSKLNVNNASATRLTGTLRVDGVGDFNSAVNINNMQPAVFSGKIRVDSTATFKSQVIIDNASLDVDTSSATPTGALLVAGGVHIGKSLSVGGDAKIGGNMTLGGKLAITDSTSSTSTTTGAVTIAGGLGLGKQLNVGGETNLYDQVTIHSTVTNGSQDAYEDYPLRVEGGKQGVAIKVDGSRTTANNFVSFWDNSGMVGRIEGQTLTELVSEDDYKDELASREWDITTGTIDVVFGATDIIFATIDVAAASSSSTVCAGLGACVTAPVPSLVVAAVAKLAIAIVNEVVLAINLDNAIDNKNDFVANANANIGVSYASSAGDYAEYLLRSDKSEQVFPGDIVGLRGGKISRNTEGAEKLMVISHKPIVLGNMPSKAEEALFEKVAFIGQVPVKVFGAVNVGDYIIADGKNHGCGIAVAPAKLSTKQMKNIVGVSWEASADKFAVKLINTGVGLNINEESKKIEALETKLDKQAQEISELKAQLTATMEFVKKALLEAKHDDHVVAQNNTSVSTPSNVPVLTPDPSNIIYHNFTQKEITEGFEAARKMMNDQGLATKSAAFWKKYDSNPEFKKTIIAKTMDKMKNSMHTHQDINAKHAAGK